MEVHQHTHIPRKKWTHYFWEFVMLFLAVFCGFMAENQREHMIEHKREKQFMASLVKDLESDTLLLSNINGFRRGRLNDIDSIILFFTRHASGTVPARGYSLAATLYGHFSFFQSTGTLEQLKHSGGLRLVRKRNVVDSIESYDKQVRRLGHRDEFETNAMLYNSNLVNKLFDGTALTKLYVDTLILKSKNPNPSQTVSINPMYLGEYLNHLRTCRNLVTNNMYVQMMLSRKATVLIELIKKEYHLK